MFSISSNRVKVVTCIYDLGRSSIDGRTINDYSNWIKKTFQLFHDVIVYYESETLRSQLDTGQNWSYKPLSNFSLSTKYDQIHKICEFQSKKSNDMTFKLPNYAMLQFEKFQFIENEQKNHPEIDGYLWVDAGISRFIGSKYPSSRKSKLTSFEKFLSEGKSLFEVDIKNNLNYFRNLKFIETGTCKRTFSGTAFYISKNDVRKYASLTYEVALDWIERLQWDNEQIALNQLFLKKSISPKILIQKGNTGSVARFALGLEPAGIISSWRIRKFNRHIS